MTIKLKSAHIENFKSLGDITLNFKDLTILVGANSSGKSNCLFALYFLNLITKNRLKPPYELISQLTRVGNKKNINIQTVFNKDNDKKKEANYQVLLSRNSGSFYQEVLYINEIKVIDIQEGKGIITDENGRNEQKYNSKKGDLALNHAGEFGAKPFTPNLAKFIEDWQFYNINSSIIREKLVDRKFNISITNNNNIDIVPRLDSRGITLEDVLFYWYKNKPNKFKEINTDLSQCLGIELKPDVEGNDIVIKVKEKDHLELPLLSMSDGTIRMLVYYTLLYQDEIPPLIGIEEPERNLNPGILKDIAAILKKLSKRTQIIITTHSSQLLDCFTYNDIMSDVAVILLSKKDDSGTQAIALDELSKKREDLTEWMQDFGVGSAVYDSHLLDEILNKQNA